MAQLIIRNIEESVKKALKRRAARHRRSMEAELREILRNAVNEDQHRPQNLGSKIASRFSDIGLETELPELKGQPAAPVDFSK